MEGRDGNVGERPKGIRHGTQGRVGPRWATAWSGSTSRSTLSATYIASVFFRPKDQTVSLLSTLRGVRRLVLYAASWRDVFGPLWGQIGRQRVLGPCVI